MKITIVGTGYVGLANAVLLAQHKQVTALDLVPEKVRLINDRILPLADAEIEDCLANKSLDLHATLDKQQAYAQAEYVVISTLTDYDPKTNHFDTSSMEGVVSDVAAINTYYQINRSDRFHRQTEISISRAVRKTIIQPLSGHARSLL